MKYEMKVSPDYPTKLSHQTIQLRDDFHSALRRRPTQVIIEQLLSYHHQKIHAHIPRKKI